MTKHHELLPFTFQPGSDPKLSRFPTTLPKSEIPVDKKTAIKIVAENAEAMAVTARRLYAENRQSLLVVLQGMDASGKDGTIRKVMSGVSPQYCHVSCFKRPSEEELDHDFLWRVHKVVPRRGTIGIFNRSHYEDVLIVRVHNLVPKSVWEKRYRQINDFEHLLAENNTRLIKCFLYTSKEEQRIQLQERIDVPEKRWKFNPGDLEERAVWDQYMEAYEAALEKCNTEFARWHIVPSDRRWYRNLLVSNLLRKTLEEMDPQFPTPKEDYSGIVIE